MAKNVIINGVAYSSVPEVDIPLSSGSGTAKFYDFSEDTAAAEHILSGKTAHGSGGPVTGSMELKRKKISRPGRLQKTAIRRSATALEQETTGHLHLPVMAIRWALRMIQSFGFVSR